MEAAREYDFMRNPHPHLLIFYRQGKPENVGPILCSICGESFRPPAFGCSKYDCNFNVHQSCIKLPSEIPSPFHADGNNGDDPYSQTRNLTISDSNNFPCNRCGQDPYGSTYITYYGRFLMILDLPCAIALHLNPSSLLNTTTPDGGELTRHFTHPHPLSLHLQTHPLPKITTIPICIVCKNPIKSSSTYYYCPQSQPYCYSYTFHPECAKLPRQILNPHHPHPLFLFALPWKFNTICVNCQNECTNFLYSCPSCWDSMNLHVYCVSSFKHQHEFQILHRKLREYECQLCFKSATNDFPWFCTICHQFAHKKCAIHQMSKHLRDQFSIQPSSNKIKTINPNRISHFSHKQHMLTLCEPLPCPGEYRVCDGCMRCISTDLSQFYACRPCGFYLHRDCATLATRYDNPLLHLHELSMVYTPDFVFSCSVCLQYCHGFAYYCGECHYVIDIRCAAIKVPFTHSSHLHSLSDYNGNVKHKCKACGEDLKHKQSVGCEECNFYLDLRCAHLPIEVRNRFDEHPLILRFGNDPQIEGKEEYCCDICEEEREEEEWFYDCGLCCFAAHPRCVVGDFPFLKSIKFEGHPHPLNWVLKRERLIDCSACEKYYDGNLGFECRRCKEFNVHAFGECYQEQLTQGRITTIMPSLRCRSIPLYQDQLTLHQT